MGRIFDTRRKVKKDKRANCADASARVLFLKYAFPCAGVTLARGAITKREHDVLEKAARMGKAIPWKMLERIFVPAWRRIREVARVYSTDSHSPETIRAYYLRFHNRYIAARDGSYKYAPKALCRLCRVEKGKIVSLGDDFFIVKIRGRDRPISRMLCNNARIGDTVSVHYGYAVEKINAKMRFDSALSAFASPA